ncbi:MAG: hypothetical protein O7G86_19300 [Gammaproteobacteria bacterium]|nr:hypothetical protein [Gammaproteobacteria bacterium]MCZ6856068.1 hypothetical protein [Gammaproteobacteria bacterium]
MSDTYCFLHLRGAERNWQPLKETLDAHVLPNWEAAEIVAWGVWHGLFGVASNELIVMAASNAHKSLDEITAPLAGIAEVQRAELLTNTVRPVDTRPCERQGLYVFRFFDVLHKDVDEIVQLSNEAWKSFENVENYQAEPQGLFCQRDLGEVSGKMLLVTWYDGLGSWQTSRRPPDAARDNFRRRHDLTRSTVAIATRLVPQVP